ncbi:MAG: S41 family peptidase, partial [Bacteroidota bacterium]
MRNTLLSLLVTLSTFSLSAQDHYQAVFDAMRPTRTLLDFMVNAQFVEDEKGALIKSIQQLEKEGTKLNQVASDSIRVGMDYALITPASALTHYQEVSGQTWLDVVDGISKAEMMENYKRASKAIGLRTNMTIRMGQVYLKSKADRLTGLGILFYTGRNVFNIGIGLPFAIPESIDELTQDQRDRILDELQNLRQMVEIIVKNYVHPSEMALYPTFNRQLTSTQRLYGLTQFWTEVKYNFAFFDQVPKLNWDQKLLEYLPIIEKEQSNESYYKNMQRLCATLQDGHTNIYVPAYVRNAYDSPALQLKNIQQKAIVTNTTDELIDQVPLGSEILSVDDVLTQKYLETEIFPYISSSTDYILYDFGIRDLLDGASGTIVNIKYQKPDQSIHELTLPRNFSQTGATWIKEREPWQWTNFKMLENDIAYVALNSFSSEKVVEEFEQYLDTLKNSKAVIIDLRKNGGGSSSNGYSILQYFANKAFLGSSWKTREHRPAFKA